MDKELYLKQFEWRNEAFCKHCKRYIGLHNKEGLLIAYGFCGH